MSNSTNVAPQRVLFVRMDRIGDLILTLPADQHPLFTTSETFWFISQELGFVPQNAVPKRSFFEWKKDFSFSQFFLFVKKVHELKPDVSVSFHSPWWVTLALFLARVPRRVGVLSSWHSYLFLNRGLRQKRSRCELHELDYNHQLIQKTLAPDQPTEPSHLQLSATPENLKLPARYVVIHPGMAGSALNWPLSHYHELIQTLVAQTSVVITGTAIDRKILEPLRSTLPASAQIVWLNEQLNPQQLLFVLQNANVVFAPSTGVIHLAASLGVPTRGIYSPVVVQRAQRWGPRGKNVKTWTPQVACPAHFECLGKSCPHFDCMELVRPQEIADNILQLINH